MHLICFSWRIKLPSRTRRCVSKARTPMDGVIPLFPLEGREQPQPLQKPDCDRLCPLVLRLQWRARQLGFCNVLVHMCSGEPLDLKPLSSGLVQLCHVSCLPVSHSKMHAGRRDSNTAWMERVGLWGAWQGQPPITYQA